MWPNQFTYIVSLFLACTFKGVIFDRESGIMYSTLIFSTALHLLGLKKITFIFIDNSVNLYYILIVKSKIVSPYLR